MVVLFNSPTLKERGKVSCLFTFYFSSLQIYLLSFFFSIGSLCMFRFHLALKLCVYLKDVMRKYKANTLFLEFRT